ncbi:hypothetical protein [Thermomonospora umbrina]|uniref:Single-stranded DNA-binding protein n=1 Tax=Thermomonospora umbrina TaxID=111806 RepID=A0A3D9T0Z8_9ACTN|nr:hypothetical protein [Thermomonospora umbrina]REF00491.1 hypothetical protein DFJ69_6035 [Thermomonospora umbrina]
MMNSDFCAEIIGHIDSDIRQIELRDGVGCSFRIQTLRTYTDEWGVLHNKPMWIPVITFDTTMTAKITRDFPRGSFVQIISRELRWNEPRQAKNGKYYNNVDFVIDAIESARNEVPADAGVIAGVTV